MQMAISLLLKLVVELVRALEAQLHCGGDRQLRVGGVWLDGRGQRSHHAIGIRRLVVESAVVLVGA